MDRGSRLGSNLAGVDGEIRLIWLDVVDLLLLVAALVAHLESRDGSLIPGPLVFELVLLPAQLYGLALLLSLLLCVRNSLGGEDSAGIGREGFLLSPIVRRRSVESALIGLRLR